MKGGCSVFREIRVQRKHRRLTSNFCSRLRIQLVDATAWLNISAGVWKLSVFLGRSFNLRARAFSLACE